MMGIRHRSSVSGSQKGNNDADRLTYGTMSDSHHPDDRGADKTGWLERRERLVRAALEDEDLGQLGQIAALPGGFGTDDLRKEAWSTLLRARQFFPADRSQRPAEDHPGPEDQAPGDTNFDAPRMTSQRALTSVKGGLLREGEEGAAEQGEGGPTKDASTASDNDSASSSAPPPSSTNIQFSEIRDTPARGEPKAHPDEYQVLLDTKRSFVSYPKGLPADSKLAMQADLQALIVHVLRLYPSLSYFQGFHDIMSVLYLTFIPLPPAPIRRSRSASVRSRERSTSGHNTPFSGAMTPMSPDEAPPGDHGDLDQTVDEKAAAESSASRVTEAEEKPPTWDRGRDATSESSVPAVDRDTPAWIALKQCAEVVSVCRVRDAMGSGMEPMMGMLKILQRLLHAADPDLSRFSAAISPVPTLPFFALSWILCLFSHDIDTLEPVQRMFDFLLSRNPISAIYLAVAIMVAKKDRMFELAQAMGPEAEDDPSLLHPLFSRLPPLVADTPGDEDALGPGSADLGQNAGQQGGTYDDERNPYDPIPISRIFQITDDLLARHPWDGPIIRGKEIMGPGSVVYTYENEHLVKEDKWDLHVAEGMANKEVILPGATMPDEPEEEEPPKRTPRRRPLKRRQQKQVAVALGVVVVGVGIALYGWRAGGSKAGWTGWWAAVMRSWVGRRTWERGQGVLGRVEDMLMRRVSGIMS